MDVRFKHFSNPAQTRLTALRMDAVRSAHDSVDPNDLDLSDIPIPASRVRVEHGTLRRRTSQQRHVLSLKNAFQVKNGYVPSFVPAGLCQDRVWMEEQRQDFRISQNPRAHHFNWLGSAVNFRSKTPPAVSLVVIMSLLGPKGLTFGTHNRNFYKATLLNNALATVDPVYYFGDDANILSKLQGTKLQEAITGQVVRIYTEYGWWHQVDNSSSPDDEDVPEVDGFDERLYKLCGVVANGWFENCEVPTSRAFIELDFQTNIENARKRQDSMLKRVTHLKVGSPLRNSFDQGKI